MMIELTYSAKGFSPRLISRDEVGRVEVSCVVLQQPSYFFFLCLGPAVVFVQEAVKVLVMHEDFGTNKVQKSEEFLHLGCSRCS